MRLERLATSVPPEVVASAQAILLPLHAPLRTSTVASKPVPPTTVTVCWLEVATKEYQTSKLELEVKIPHVIGEMDCVAVTVVPDVAPPHILLNTVSAMAPEHSSLAGGGGGVPTQIVKVADAPTVEEVVYTLTR